jgi:hypothetical protein
MICRRVGRLLGVPPGEGCCELLARQGTSQFDAGLTAAASNPNGVVRIEDALGFLFLHGKLLTSRRPPRFPTPNPEALEHF